VILYPSIGPIPKQLGSAGRPACWLLVATLLEASVWSPGTCLKIEAQSGRSVTLPASLGSDFSLSFRHSLYGSSVEEHFRITTKGLQIFKLRYSERRLIEFYGHESGRFDNGWWVVEGNRGEVQTLALWVSPESLAKIHFRSGTIALSDIAEPTSLVRVRVTSCEK